MIVSKNIHPERDVYYLGAKVIDILGESSSKEFDYLELYQVLREDNNISINLFSLVVDWLFIIGVVKKGYKGLEKCF
ncbi:hypothetical protein SapgrDRAFT_1623 [Saprospira grandis DSM 2844]|uniref:Uncharacterized protein n=1 Tax=Saprospira grandis DSM 2844 TaxID=694433 RepID=J1I3N2_9BACT|nr:ABC-three component system middle component 6 [Saprospira grandis]EJF53330.1 hypothetical protein SapgrDRAFT_1623 [Saprospira grandis DSM 2844]